MSDVNNAPAPTEPKPSTTHSSEPTLLNQTEPKTTETEPKPPSSPSGAPESYTDFKLPEGYELDKGIKEEVGPLFKGMNLSQDQAQQLVDLYSKHALKTHEESLKLWSETREKWISEAKADPEIGGKLPEVKAVVSRAIDGLGNSALATAFREAMDYTGAGNHPAFIKVFYALAQKVTEGQHVSGSPLGTRQARPGSAAEAIYGPSGPRSGGPFNT